MRLLLTLLLMWPLFGAQAQLRTINPKTFPLTVSDAVIFNDGSAYFVTGDNNYFVKCSDIENPVQASYNYKYLGEKEFTHIWCNGPRYCLARSKEETTLNREVIRCYRSYDRGQSWQRVSVGMGGTNYPHFPDPTFMVSDKDGKLRASVDWGQNWTYYDTVRRYRYIGKEAGTALVWNLDSGWVHRLSRGSFQFHFDAQALGKNYDLIRLVPDHDGYLAATAVNDIVDIDLQNDTITTVFPGLRYSSLRKFGDTLLISNYPVMRYSLDNGRNWTVDSSFYADIRDWQSHGNRFYNFNRLNHVAGHWMLIDLQNSSFSNSAGSKFTSGNSGLVPIGEGYMYFQNGMNQFPFDPKGYVLNDSGKISVTYDFPNEKIRLWRSIAFADSLHGIAFYKHIDNASRQNAFAVTADGGKSWQKHLPRDTGALTQIMDIVKYPEPQKCAIALNNNSQLLFFNQTFDWEKTRKLPSYIGGVMGMHFTSCQKGILVADNGVYLTEDQGATFTEKSGIPYSEIVRSFSITDTSILVGTDEFLYHADSIDGNYSKIGALPQGFRPINYWLTPDQSLFYFREKTNTIHYSNDSGKSFQKAPLPSTSLIDVAQTNDTTFLLSAEGGVLHRLYLTDSLIIDDDPNISIGEP